MLALEFIDLISFTVMMSRLIGVWFFLFALPAYSLILDQFQIPANAKVGIIISTFDPITTYHEEVIRAALASGEVDYIVVVPTDFTPHKLRRETMDHRQKMLELTYRDNPKVVVAGESYAHRFPQSRNIAKFIKEKQPSSKTTGVALFEDLKGSGIKRKIASFLTPVDQWLILASKDSNTSGFPKDIEKKPVRFIEVEHPKSSSEVRKKLLRNTNFFNHSDVADELSLPLNSTVKEYIRRNKLYFNKASLCSMALDFYRSF